jgi:hypothetical protein
MESAASIGSGHYVGASRLPGGNEVRRARQHLDVALSILSNTAIDRADSGTMTVTGRDQGLYDPWHIDDGTLMPGGLAKG